MVLPNSPEFSDDQIRELYEKHSPKILEKAKKYVSKYVEATSNPSTEFSDTERRRLRRWGYAFEMVRQGAKVGIEEAADQVKVDEATLWFFENGFPGGEIVTVEQLASLSVTLTSHLEEVGNREGYPEMVRVSQELQPIINRFSELVPDTMVGQLVKNKRRGPLDDFSRLLRPPRKSPVS